MEILSTLQFEGFHPSTHDVKPTIIRSANTVKCLIFLDILMSILGRT